MRSRWPYRTKRVIAGRTRTIVFEPSLLNIIRGGNAPQTGEELVNSLSPSTIDELIQMQFQEGRASPDSDGPIVLTEEDWEG